MADRVDLTMFAGDTQEIQITCSDADGALPLTGASIDYVLKTAVDATANAVTKDETDGIAISGDTDEIFTVTLDPADTTTLRGVYYHEAQVVFANGQAWTVFTGFVCINPSGV